MYLYIQEHARCRLFRVNYTVCVKTLWYSPIYSICVLVFSVRCINYVDYCISVFIYECAYMPLHKTMNHSLLMNACKQRKK